MERRDGNIYEFAGFRLIPGEGLLLHNGEQVLLAPKAFSTLVMLVEQHGHLVEKADLIERVWENAFVEEAAVSRCVWGIRNALGEDPKKKKFIQTVPKRGYRFVGEVTEFNSETNNGNGKSVGNTPEALGTAINELSYPAATSPDTGPGIVVPFRVSRHTTAAEPEPRESLRKFSEKRSSAPHRMAKPLIAAVVGVILFVGGFFAYQYLAPAKQIESIAVMPFVNETGNPDVEYLSDGMTDTLISSLSELPKIKVKARTSVFRYKGKEINPKVVGKELSVQAIVNGRVSQRDGRTKVTLEVIDTETEDVIFSTKYDKPQSELVTLQGTIARDVSRKLLIKLSGVEEAKVTKTHTADPEALQLYLQGQFYRRKGARNNLLLATDYFNKAIEKDPNYALAYAGLASNYSSYYFYNLVPHWAKARAAAKRALELDDSLAEAHLAAGDFRRAIELNPNYADAHVALCIHLTMTKRFDEGITECRKAHELDPSSTLVTTHLGAAYFFARRPDEAIEILTRANDMDPTLWIPLGYLGAAQTLKGQYTEAAATFRKAIEITDGSPNAKSHLAYALAKAGQRDEALKLIDELKRQAEHEHVSSFHFTVPYIGLDNKDEAFFWLGKGIDERSIGFDQLNVHPWYDDLRSDPRFTALLIRTDLQK